MSDPNRQTPGRRAYTGDTIVMPDRRRAAPGPPDRARRPRPARGRIWPRIRLALLVLLALVLVGLALVYLQIHAVASQIVVRDVRPNPPIATPLVGGVNLLLVGVDERPDHPEEGIRSDTLIVNGYNTAQALVYLLKQCGDDLTRESVMRHAANLKDVELGMLLPGIRLNTSPSDFAPVKQWQLMRFEGTNWHLFGDAINGETRD